VARLALSFAPANPKHLLDLSKLGATTPTELLESINFPALLQVFGCEISNVTHLDLSLNHLERPSHLSTFSAVTAADMTGLQLSQVGQSSHSRTYKSSTSETTYIFSIYLSASSTCPTFVESVPVTLRSSLDITTNNDQYTISAGQSIVGALSRITIQSKGPRPSSISPSRPF
jgi:hypothetical protein